MQLELCIGKLDSTEKYDRIELKKYLKNINTIKDGPFKNGYNFEYEINKIRNLDEVDKIRVWSSHLDCTDYCLLLFVCNYFGDKNISVVFSEEYNWYATTCTKLNENEINELIKKEHILKEYDIEQYKKEWNQIVKDNKELRYMINGTVKSVDIDYFNKSILNRLEQLGEVNLYTLIADLMEISIIPFVYYADYIYLYMINSMIDKNLIKKNEKSNKIYRE